MVRVREQVVAVEPTAWLRGAASARARGLKRQSPFGTAGATPSALAVLVDEARAARVCDRCGRVVPAGERFVTAWLVDTVEHVCLLVALCGPHADAEGMPC